MVVKDYMPPIRYMGTKFGLRQDILRELLGDGPAPRLVVDPFCGTGAVASWLAGGPNILIGDSLSFPLAIARSSVLAGATVSNDLENEVVEAATLTVMAGREQYGRQIAEEEAALASSPCKLEAIIASSRHVGNDTEIQAQSKRDAAAGAHSLTRLYFARGYFSTSQAIALDALRAAIDSLCPPRLSEEAQWSSSSERDGLLSMWLSGASAIVNSPGHTAQFLHARSASSQARVRRAWRLDALVRFRSARLRVRPKGSEAWRLENCVVHGDALATLDRVRPSSDTVVYADPPYTKDQYSRMYHVLETLYLYDYPDSVGVGRSRSGRSQSAFSSRKNALSAFESLLAMSAGRGMRTVISYPTAGLLPAGELLRVLSGHGAVKAIEIPLGHSTLGGRRGRGRVPVTEGLYVVSPSTGGR